MYQLAGFRDVEDLKWKVASDPNVIRALASFAHMLGFGWCGGTRSQAVGEDFDVRKDGDRYVLQAHYNSSDPYHDGYWADKRLRITLSNFRIGFDPRSFVYGTPVIKDLAPAAIASYLARNESNTEDSVTKTFTFQLSETVTHTTNYSFTEGIKVSVKWGAKIPFFGGGETTTEFSFSATQGWSDSTATNYGQQDTSTYTGKLPARSQRLIRLIANRVSSDITYSAVAQIGFDIEFYGFLRWSGNARSDHPQDRPFVTLSFGNSTYNGLEDIWDKWTHREITGYWGWDWGWMQQNFGGWLDNTMNFIGGGIGAPTSGKFNDVKGTYVYTSADDPQPIPRSAMAESTPGMTELVAVGALEAARMATITATRETLREVSGLNVHIADELLLHTDEIPGARVIGIE
ncbi:aerolysin family beta-barrel pore-forming toxin [Fischerella sp. PCC 9605]|uniref:aerolysin family beta-barrel pore-forming toxin n=1 Tax=Fischerella sp. PCC 9605 TaxID=1173024 RepID=UPI000688B7B7|nr:aerolysin family beta-barrel pore-forming toxin [Fischerella sp. PCC 9605]